MAIAIATNERGFVLKDDLKLPKEQRTTFKIKPLSAKQYHVSQDLMSFTGKGKDIKIENISVHTLDILKCGLIGWSNFKDEDGKDVQFEEDMDKNLNRIAVEDRYEISAEITTISSLKVEQSKN